MGVSLRPDTAKQRISRNVDKMLAQGASESEVEQYLMQEEGLRPVGSPAAHDAGDISLRPVADATRVSPSAKRDGDVSDVIASGLTGGAASKIDAVARAAIAKAKGGNFMNTYRDRVAGNQSRLEHGREITPGAALIEAAAGIVPSLALPVGRAVTTTGQMIEGAKLSGILSMLGAANATKAETPIEAAKDVGLAGALGGLLGAATPVAGAAAGTVGRGIRKGIGYMARSAEKIGDIRAGERLLGSFGMDKLSLDDVVARERAAAQSDLPGTLAHVVGESTDPLTYHAGQSRSTAGADLRRGVENAKRQESRMLGRGLDRAAGVSGSPDRLASTVRETRTAAGKKNYPAAFAGPDIRSEEILETIQADPVFRHALANGVKLMKREGIDVKDPTSIADIVAALRKQGVPDRAIERSGYSVDAELPVQLFDYMKRGLDMSVKKGLRMGDLDERAAQITMGKMQKLLAQVDPQAPLYETARGTHASLSGRLEAIEAGRKAWRSSSSADQVAEVMAGIADPVERQDFLVGLTGSAKRAASKKGRSTAVTPSVFDSDDIEQKLITAYGKRGYEKLRPFLEHGRTVNRVNRRVLGGSPTAERVSSEDREFKQAATNLVRGATSPSRAMYDIPGKMIDAKERQINAAMQDRLATILGIPIGDPRMQEAVAFLQQAQGRAATDATRAVSRPRAPERQRVGGILANLLGQAAGQ